MITHDPFRRIKHRVAAGLWVELAIVLLAAAARLFLLDLKPAHFDEGVNGWFVDQMTKEGFFRYDPTNYHGPLHFYVLFLSQTLLGRNLWALRLPVVAVGVLTVALALCYRRFVGRFAARVAALFLAVSPGMVFYNRYSIHESWLVLFLMAAVWGVAGLLRTGRPGWLWPAMLGPVGAILTKETYAVHAGCFLLAWPVLALLETVSPSAAPPSPPRRWRARDLAGPLAAGLGAILFFYSGNLYNLGGISGLWETFAAWGATGTEGKTGHEKEWYYWLQLLARYEPAALAGMAGSLLLVARGTPRLVRYLGIVGCGSLAAYSLIRYKTPWCILPVMWPFFFVLGHWAQKLRPLLPRGMVAAALVPLFAATCWAAVRLNWFRFTDDSEPYVYVQTYEDIRKMEAPLAELVRRDPANHHLPGKVVLPSYYPLPWLLGDFTRVGYYQFKDLRDPADAAFLLVEEERAPTVEKMLGETYFVEEIRIRSAQERARLYLNARWFRGIFPEREPEFPSSP